jgi:tetratricopeptide (TPR) repeat protein
VLFDYVYDDNLLIITNPWVSSWKYVPAIFTHSFWGFLDIPRQIDFYRPIVMLTLVSIYRLLGPAPGWFHLAATAIHVLATYLVFRLAQETTGDGKLAALAAGIFGLHPTKVESAAWISGISDSLSLVFFLGCVIFYFQWTKAGKQSVKKLAISATLLLLALFSKEAAIFAPLLIAVYEFGASSAGFRRRCVTAFRASLPFVFVVFGALCIRALLVRTATGQILNKPPLLMTLLTAPKAVLWYLEKQLWPIGLSVQYPVMAVRHFSISQFLLPLFVLLAIFSTVVFVVRKRPTGIFFVVWFVVMLGPVLVYQLDLQQHDRYFYFASVSTSIGLAYLLLQVIRRSVAAQAITVSALLIASAALTLHYESFWDNDNKLFDRAVSIAPDSPNAVEYEISLYSNAGDFKKAEELADHLIRNPEQCDKGWYLLGNIRMAEGNYAGAREAMQTALQTAQHRKFLPHLGIAAADLKLGRPDEAASIYRDELKHYPHVPYLHANLAYALNAAGRTAEAKKEELQMQTELR